MSNPVAKPGKPGANVSAKPAATSPVKPAVPNPVSVEPKVNPVTESPKNPVTDSVATLDESVTNTVAESATESGEPKPLYDGPCTVSGLMLTMLVKNIGKYNVLKARFDASSGNKAKAIDNFKANSQDEQAIAIRNQIRELQAKLHEYAELQVKSEDLSDDEKTKLEEEMDAAAKKVNSGYTSVTLCAEQAEQDYDGVIAVLNTINNPTKSKRGRKPGIKGSDLPRASAVFTISGGNIPENETVVKDTFSGASMYLKCEAKDLQIAFAKAAEVDIKNIGTVNRPLEFSFLSHNNGQTYTIKTTVKAKAKPGRKPANAKGESAAAMPAA